MGLSVPEPVSGRQRTRAWWTGRSDQMAVVVPGPCMSQLGARGTYRARPRFCETHTAHGCRPAFSPCQHEPRRLLVVHGGESEPSEVINRDFPRHLVGAGPGSRSQCVSPRVPLNSDRSPLCHAQRSTAPNHAASAPRTRLHCVARCAELLHYLALSDAVFTFSTRRSCIASTLSALSVES